MANHVISRNRNPAGGLFGGHMFGEKTGDRTVNPILKKMANNISALGDLLAGQFQLRGAILLFPYHWSTRMVTFDKGTFRRD